MHDTSRAIDVPALLRRADQLLQTTVSVRGHLRVRGHLPSVQLVLEDSQGEALRVSASMPRPRPLFDLLGRDVVLTGLLMCDTPTTFVLVVSRAQPVGEAACDDALDPGVYLSLAGRVENRELVAIGGEAPPPGSYLLLTAPLRVADCETDEVFLEHPVFRAGDERVVFGRLELRSHGGVETPLRHYVALSGVSDLCAGEPYYDGARFKSPLDGGDLRTFVIRRGGLYDAPDTVVVLDGGQSRAFFGSLGGLLPPDRNPFHGFFARAEILAPSDDHRDAVRFEPDGTALDAETLQPLILLAREEPPPNTADMFTHEWYYDPAQDLIYHFVSGGIAGFLNRLQSVIQGPGAAADEEE